jgi:2-methylisocitrate lyase-like PEP mutase family enzyme
MHDASLKDILSFAGFSISAARLGLPDVGLISYGEMIDQGRLITEAVSIPVIGDADNGYGNCMNVKRTVKGFINAGFAGIILEDQVCLSITADNGYITILEDHTLVLVISSILYVEITV